MCETWLHDDDHLGLYYLGLGYQKIVTRNRLGKKGGGIAAFVIEGLHVDAHTIESEKENMIW